MFWSVCSAKGGVGTSVVTAALATALSRKRPVLLVDVAGDQPDLLGVEVGDVGVRDWLRADESVPTANLAGLIVDVAPGLQLLPAGSAGDLSVVAGQRSLGLVETLSDPSRLVISDLGVLDSTAFSAPSVILASSSRTTLVVRACYVGLRRAQRLAIDTDDVVEIFEGGRALRTIDIEAVLGRPVTTRIPLDPLIARAADAGLLTKRLPRSLRRLASDLADLGGAAA